MGKIIKSGKRLICIVNTVCKSATFFLAWFQRFSVFYFSIKFMNCEGWVRKPLVVVGRKCMNLTSLLELGSKSHALALITRYMYFKQPVKSVWLVLIHVIQSTKGVVSLFVALQCQINLPHISTGDKFIFIAKMYSASIQWLDIALSLFFFNFCLFFFFQIVVTTVIESTQCHTLNNLFAFWNSLWNQMFKKPKTLASLYS